MERPPVSTSTPPAAVSPRRRRDRHGRGMRGPLAPRQVPIALSRSELFDDYVRESVERLERRWPQLEEVEFAVQDVPAPLPGEPEPVIDDVRADEVPLGRLIAAVSGTPARIVVYRRPVEIRAKGRDERAALVHDVMVEQVAELLGVEPEAVDPRYGEE
ncbi:metallopeptidase family protein [Streptacidiphilus sp. MAP5-3]|uniref:metallopeptidase family protein n=1 Tax=unclassified Streptacidiphilus TaxID=2643834 RepID=UPI0035140818